MDIGIHIRVVGSTTTGRSAMNTTQMKTQGRIQISSLLGHYMHVHGMQTHILMNTMLPAVPIQIAELAYMYSSASFQSVALFEE